MSECLRILEKAGASQEVVDHVRLVEAVATSFAEAINDRHPGKVDLHLVTAGAMLHDLGRAQNHGIQHMPIGVKMAEDMGLDPRVVEIIRRHVGGGLTLPDAVVMGLPAWDCMPRTLEEKIVCHADTLVGDRGRRSMLQTLKHIKPKGSAIYEMRVKDLHKLLSGLAEDDLDTIGPWLLD
jgi:uncharacterized protein (TIGR00295 family)